MSLKKVQEVKSDKGFKIFDLIIYGALIVLVGVVFLSVFLTRDNSPFEGVRAYIRDACVYEYSFSDGGRTLDERVEETVTEDKVKVKISFSDGGYNVFEIDLKNKSVKMIEADCDPRGVGDCLYTPAITDNNSNIYCQPHQLLIEPLSYENGRDLWI